MDERRSLNWVGRIKLWFNRHPYIKRTVTAVIVILLVTIIILLPYMTEWIYYNVTPPTAFFDIQMQPSDLVTYFGTVFTLLATVCLGAITLHQNKVAQDKTDEVNRLTLELQRKSMAIAEEQHKQELQQRSEEEVRLEQEYAPKFEIKTSGCSSAYASLRLTVKNVTSKIVSQFNPISLTIYDSDGKALTSATQFGCQDARGNKHQNSIGAEQVITVTSDTKELRYSVKGKTDRRTYKNCTLKFEFSCENERSQQYYYRATTPIADSGKFQLLVLNCERVG